MERIFNVFKFDRFWNAEDGTLKRGIVRGPYKDLVLAKAWERAQKTRCSKVVVYREDGSKEQEELVNKDCSS
ncbi:MAG: hypothetical protein K2X86_12145 [Cytophagaceae bacterium]|nr:hypothetical protein [Cytophagaceae bacterium]